MATYDIIAAGFGGQGIMAMGQLLAYAGMLEDKSVSWLPSYGPEMRGGAANCSVVISDEPVGSPVIAQATDVIVMNDFSMRQFESHVAPGGNLLINSSLVKTQPTRDDINIYRLPVSDLAVELGNAKVANMLMLGAYLEVSHVVKKESVIKAFTKVYGDAKKKLLPINEKAIETGMNAIRNGNCQGGVCDILTMNKGSISAKDISRTPEANMRQGNIQSEPPKYLKEIHKYDEKDDEKIFSSELSIVKEAITLEKESVKFYRESAAHLGQQSTGNLFASLAKQSEEHVSYLEGLCKHIEANEKVGLMDKIKSAFNGKDTLELDEVDPKDAQLALSIITEGMSVKRQSIQFYQKAAKKSKVEYAAKLYDELEYWENFQLEQLTSQYEIHKTEWWSDQGYSPI